jgi:hypothetical protein
MTWPVFSGKKDFLKQAFKITVISMFGSLIFRNAVNIKFAEKIASVSGNSRKIALP